ncbi:phosphotransferase [Lactococcus garvieae]|jgi:aminoglycoside phosphotransferase (APT) family kinase protein|uniref:Aminoglycoside phosphotransferase domain-containing protein n=1 Tax=Lactococcus garvieae DCC43 TaxID=1231377 RepID=K2NU10_9LACT|nr:hypothetical protein [Lactococcus garvieae]EKF51013.1 hypothetical protein C426_1670 [Lactococcus garvieae DCC43]
MMKETVNKFIAARTSKDEFVAVGFNALARPKEFAQDLGNFIYQLHKLDHTGAESIELTLPVIEAEFFTLLDQMKRIAPVEELRMYWNKASKNPWSKAPVTLHGNLNLETVWVAQDKFAGAVEVEEVRVGDPAIDLTIAWEIFDDKQRKIFFSAVEADKATVVRARVWAVYKAMKNYNSPDIDQSILARDVLFRINEELGLGTQPDLY